MHTVHLFPTVILQISSDFTDYTLRLANSGAYLAPCSDIGFNQKTRKQINSGLNLYFVIN